MPPRRRKPEPDPCPQVDQHTPAPSGYLAWHEWAEEMMRTHTVRRCPGCGLYAIWIPHADTQETGPATPPHPTPEEYT